MFLYQPQIDALFQDYARGDAPGCAIGTYSDDGSSYYAAYGMADIESGIANAPTTVFNVASVSKQFTAAAVLILAARGDVSLDDEIHDHIPELPDYGSPITLRQLLSHTAGLAEYERRYFQDGGPDYDIADRAQQIAVIQLDRELEFDPGSDFAYSNTDYLLAAIVIERVSGQSLRAFADENIFGPLGMTDTAYVSDPGEFSPSKAVNYHVEEDGSFASAVFGAHSGPTGLQTTVADLQLWAQNFATGEVGGEEMLRELQTPGSLSDGTILNYALGLQTLTLGPFDAVIHDGWTIGTRAVFARFPRYETTIALLCNRDDLDPTRIVTEVASVIFD